MSTGSAEPAAVLDYAALRPQGHALRWFRAATTVLLCVLFFGGAAFALQPVRYRASGLLSVSPAWTHPRDDTQEQLNLQAAQKAQAAAVAGLKSSATLDAAIGVLQQHGISMTHGEIVERMTVRPIEQSTLTYVAFDDRTPANAAAVLNAIMTSCGTLGVTVASPASIPTRPLRNAFYSVGGLAVGLLVGVFIVARRWK
jgi:hypothetical protein